MAEQMRMSTQDASTFLAKPGAWAADRLTETKAAITQTAHHAIATTQQATDAASTATQNAITRITDTATGAIATLNTTTRQAVRSATTQVEQMPHQTAGWTGGFANAGKDTMDGVINGWLNQHPVFHWMIDHPLGAIGLLLLAIFLLWGFLRAIAYTIQQLWIVILQSPIMLARWFMRLGMGMFRKATPKPLQQGIPQRLNIDHNREQLIDLVNRLEAMREEQDQLLKEVQKLLQS